VLTRGAPASQQLTRHRDHVTKLRRELPWTAISDYSLQDAKGPVKLSELFTHPTSRDLIVYVSLLLLST
jgi:predicted dithiol-disulfide oxidoreductase (DUF899 family)